MGLVYNFLEGQTPIDAEEKEGLLLRNIDSQSELDEHEQLNIERAVEWSIQAKLTKDEVLTESFIKGLHYKMFNKVWKWAGEFRKSEKNIGVYWTTIAVELRKLLEDTHYWINNKTYSDTEIAIRFKHRLVNIHCFSNGNGRHSRLMADILMESVFKSPAFSWNGSNMVKADQTRTDYISSLKQADHGKIDPLIAFATA